MRRLLLLVLCLLTNPALAQIGPDGFDWVTVGAPGNRPYDGPDPFNLVPGRGSVETEFRMARTELTTGQALEFFNAAFARPDPLPFANRFWWGSPIIWGATRDSSYTGPGTRFRLRTDVANAAMLPVGGFSWRGAAVLCNWLTNNKSTAASAFMNGAYDVSTFTPEIAYPTWNDQLVHSPGATYYLPSLDQWMKAVHYDPNANGGQGRWYQQPNDTDTPLIYGPPPSFGGDGTGMANAGFALPNQAQYNIPLGSYPNVQTPWGLLDAAGGTTEWLETTRVLDDMTRGLDGSFWTPGSEPADWAYSWGQIAPHERVSFAGVRLASAIPAPSSVLVLILGCGALSRRGRSRRESLESLSSTRAPDRT